MNCDERLAFFYAIADAFVEFEADSVVDGVFLFFAAAAESGESGAKLFAVYRGEEACGGAEDIGAGLGLREKPRIIDDTLVTALQANALLEFLLCLAGGDHGFGEEAAILDGFGAVAEKKHPGGKLDAQLDEIGGTSAVENLDAFSNFVRMAGHAAKRLVHVGNKSDDFLFHALAGFDHEFGEENGIFFALHEGAGTGFDVENEGVDAFGEFFAHDGGTDEADIFDSGSGVAQGVDFFVGGSNFGGLTDEAHAAFAEHAVKILQGEIYVEAGDGFELVERAAGVAEATTADHGNGEASGGGDGGENERGFVADATGGMLVHFSAGDAGEIEDLARAKHGLGERGELGTIDAANPRGHEPGGHLVIGNFAEGVAGDQEVNLLAGVLTGITFFADEVDGAHASRKTEARA